MDRLFVFLISHSRDHALGKGDFNVVYPGAGTYQSAAGEGPLHLVFTQDGARILVLHRNQRIDVDLAQSGEHEPRESITLVKTRHHNIQLESFGAGLSRIESLKRSQRDDLGLADDGLSQLTCVGG